MPEARSIRVVGPGKRVRVYKTIGEAADAIGTSGSYLANMLRQTKGAPRQYGDYLLSYKTVTETVTEPDVSVSPPVTKVSKVSVADLYGQPPVATIFRGTVFHGGLVVLEPKESARGMVQKSVSFGSIDDVPDDLYRLTDFGALAPRRATPATEPNDLPTPFTVSPLRNGTTNGVSNGTNGTAH